MSNQLMFTDEEGKTYTILQLLQKLLKEKLNIDCVKTINGTSIIGKGDIEITPTGITAIEVEAGPHINEPGVPTVTTRSEGNVTIFTFDYLKGAIGARGEQGIEGPQGDIGPRGPQGEPGLQGDTGPQGAQGQRGEKGDTGEQGEQGPTGLTALELKAMQSYAPSSGNVTIDFDKFNRDPIVNDGFSMITHYNDNTYIVQCVVTAVSDSTRKASVNKRSNKLLTGASGTEYPLYKHRIVADVKLVNSDIHHYIRITVINSLSSDMPTTDFYHSISNLLTDRGVLNIEVGQMEQDDEFYPTSHALLYVNDIIGSIIYNTEEVDTIEFISQITSLLDAETW